MSFPEKHRMLRRISPDFKFTRCQIALLCHPAGLVGCRCQEHQKATGSSSGSLRRKMKHMMTISLVSVPGRSPITKPERDVNYDSLAQRRPWLFLLDRPGRRKRTYLLRRQLNQVDAQSILLDSTGPCSLRGPTSGHRILHRQQSLPSQKQRQSNNRLRSMAT